MFSSPYIPSSSDYMIVIPFNKEDNKFSRTSYSASMTGGRASSEEINQVLTLLDLTTSNIPTGRQIITRLIIRFLVPAVMIWILAEAWRCYRHAEPTILLFWYMLASLIYILVRRNSQVKEAKGQVQKIIQRFQPTFEERGLRWNIPLAFPHYIELCRDYREKFFEAQIPPYNPQVNVQLTSSPQKKDDKGTYQQIADTDSSER